MKSIFRLAAVLSIAAWTFSACSQNDEPILQDNVTLDLNINTDVAGTRAIDKTGWAENEIIYLVFLEEDTKWSQTTAKVVGIQYKSAKWDLITDYQATLNSISKSGKIIAAYYASGQTLTWKWDANSYKSNESVTGLDIMGCQEHRLYSCRGQTISFHYHGTFGKPDYCNRYQRC